MSSLNLTASNTPYANGRAYGENLSRAARAFIAALLAVKPAASMAAPAALPKQLTDRQRIAAVLELNRMASHYDSLMPSQAAELRYLARQC